MAKKKKVAKKKVRAKKGTPKKDDVPQATSIEIGISVEKSEELKKLNKETDSIESAMTSLATEVACGRVTLNDAVRHILRLSDRVKHLRAHWDVMVCWDSPLLSDSQMAELGDQITREVVSERIAKKRVGKKD